MSKKKFYTGDLVVVLESKGETLHAGQLLEVSTSDFLGNVVCKVVGTVTMVVINKDRLALAKDHCSVLTVRERSGRVFPVIKGILPEGGAVYVEIDKEADTYLDSYLEGEAVKDYSTSVRKVNGVDTTLAGFVRPVEEISDAVFHKSPKIGTLSVSVSLEEDIQKSLESIKKEIENLKRAYNVPVIGDYVVGELLSERTKVIGQVIEEDYDDEDNARYKVEVISEVPYNEDNNYLIGLHLYVKDSTVKKLSPELNHIEQLKEARHSIVSATNQLEDAREKVGKVVENLFVDAN